MDVRNKKIQKEDRKWEVLSVIMCTIPHPISILSCGSFSPFVFLFLFYWFLFCALYLLIYCTYCPISFSRFQLLLHTFCSCFRIWCLLILLMTVFLLLSFLGAHVFSCKHTYHKFMYQMLQCVQVIYNISDMNTKNKISTQQF